MIQSFKDLVRSAPKDLQNLFWQQWKAPQNPVHHPEGNTLKHIAVVVTRAIRQHPDDMDIILAALFHDLGKAFTLDFKNGNPTAHGHEKESEKFVDKYRDWITSMGGNPAVVKYIVANHMKVKSHVWDVIQQKKKAKITGDPSYPKLDSFGKIDKGGLNFGKSDKGELNEDGNILNKIYYHGSRTPLPFKQFDPRLIGTGIVSSGNPYGGFFFTSEKQNADFYTEYFVVHVTIDNLVPNPTQSHHPPTVMQQAVKDGKNYVVDDILDGATYSDVAVVPAQNSNQVHILEWEFVGDAESYVETLDKIFRTDDEDAYIDHDLIAETLRMIQVDLNYLLAIPIFKQYWDSK